MVDLDPLDQPNRIYSYSRPGDTPALTCFTIPRMVSLLQVHPIVRSSLPILSYFFVIALFLGLAIAVGRRAGCHSICWMAPFMMIGCWIRNRFSWPSLRLIADASACADCKLCTKNCPMSIDVNAMVQIEQMENQECILCGTCMDNCSKSAIRYSFSSN